MKLIGITGSCGKTSVAEIIYQYLLFHGYNTSLYCSNGLFVNGLTREKDFLQTTLYHKDLKNLLKEDEENFVDFAVIEITAESVKRNDQVHLLPYDVLAMTNFFSSLHNHFESKDDYYNCKRSILLNPNAKKILLRIEDENYNMFSDINHITYGYSNTARHQLNVVSNTINGLNLSFQGLNFTTNLITAYHARNLACALAILTELDVLDMQSFIEFSKKIFIRGRFEKIIFNNKNIIIDTGQCGADIVINGLENTIGSSNYKIIYSSIHYKNITDWVKKARSRVGVYLKRSKLIYLTNPSSSIDEEGIFYRDVIVKNDFDKVKYIPDIDQACSIAINELQNDETLIIFAREHYRKYRQAFEKLI